MSERAERLRREVWRWLRLAREDLAAAKAIKAVLVAEDMDPPKLHDPRRLLERSASPIMAALDEPALEDLSRWSIAGRYPANGGHPARWRRSG
jgi:HEPN domain-containing protein